VCLFEDNRLYCGDALGSTAYAILMGAEKAAAVFTDPPYNVKIDGHVSGRTHHAPQIRDGIGRNDRDEEFAKFLT
jgi:DNA modification methylase